MLQDLGNWLFCVQSCSGVHLPWALSLSQDLIVSWPTSEVPISSLDFISLDPRYQVLGSNTLPLSLSTLILSLCSFYFFPSSQELQKIATWERLVSFSLNSDLLLWLPLWLVLSHLSFKPSTLQPPLNSLWYSNAVCDAPYFLHFFFFLQVLLAGVWPWVF